MKLRNNILMYGTVVLICGLAGYLFISEDRLPALTEQEQSMVDKLFKQTKPQCIGRYIIDIPEIWDNISHNNIFIDDFRIESQPLYLPAFKQRIALREKELKEQSASKENSPVLKEIIQLPDNKGVIFDRNNLGVNDGYRTLETHIYVDEVAFIITSNIFDLSATKHASEKNNYIEKLGFSELDTNTRPQKLSALQSLISRLSGRKDNEIPVEAGVCIPNGFIKDDGNKHTEKISFFYDDKDFSLDLNTNNLPSDPNDTLFKRSAGINAALWSTYFTTLEKRAVVLQGIPAEMWLFGGEQDYRGKKMRVYNFDFYANEGTSSSDTPWLNIVLNSEYRQTQYKEAQMIEIWNRLLNTLRYRPIK